MSFVNKGSMAATVTVSREPDRSGNYRCDGAADQTEINLAIAEVNRRGGGTIIIKEGNYEISAQINMMSDVAVEGMGVEATIITLAAGVNLGANVGMFHCISDNNVTIGNLTLNGNDGHGAACMGLYVYWNADPGVGKLKFHDLTIHNCSGQGIKMSRGPAYYDLYTEIESVYIYDCGSFGLHLLNVCNLHISRYYQDRCFTSVLDTATRFTIESSVFESSDGGTGTDGVGLRVIDVSEGIIESCQFLNNDSRGLTVENGVAVTVSNCRAESNAYSGFLGNGANMRNVVFVGCISNGNGINGFAGSDDAIAFSVIGCRAYNNGTNGINLSHGNYHSAIGNHCWDNGQNVDANRQNGISIGYATEPSTYCTVVGNTCWDSGGGTQLYGVYERHVNTDYNMIHDNNLMGNATGSLYILGVNTSAFGNRCDGVSTIAVGTAIPTREWLVTYGAGGIGLTGDVPLAALTNGQSAAIGFECPPDLQQLVRAYLKVLPTATQAAANWDLNSDYGGVGEAPNIHTETDAATTYNVTNLQWYDIELVALGFFANLAVGDRGGIRMTVSTAGHTASVFSMIFEYL